MRYCPYCKIQIKQVKTLDGLYYVCKKCNNVIIDK